MLICTPHKPAQAHNRRQQESSNPSWILQEDLEGTDGHTKQSFILIITQFPPELKYFQFLFQPLRSVLVNSQMSECPRLGLDIEVADTAMPYHPGVEKPGTSLQSLNLIRTGLRLCGHLPQKVSYPRPHPVLYSVRYTITR